jgi:hypothetical protein
MKLARRTTCAVVVLSLVGCSGSAGGAAARPEARHCPHHAAFAVYYLGRSVRRHRLVDGFTDCKRPSQVRGGASAYVAYEYGTCNVSQSIDPVPCMPPVELSSEPLGECHAMHPRSSVRGVPARVEEHGAEIALYTGVTTVEISARNGRLGRAAARALRLAPRAFIPRPNQTKNRFPRRAQGRPGRLPQPRASLMRRKNSCS